MAITGDLQKAFLQVRVKEIDQDAIHFHWHQDEQSPLETLRFTRALFGLAPSPFLLGGVIEMHFNNWEEREPELVAKIRKELYVDDLISGSTTVCETRELTDKTKEIFQDACFNLHKWHSNVPELESEQSPKGYPVNSPTDQLADANFPFVNSPRHLKRSMPFLRTVVAISNGRCHF